jgi:hypothetical protein
MTAFQKGISGANARTRGLSAFLRDIRRASSARSQIPIAVQVSLVDHAVGPDQPNVDLVRRTRSSFSAPQVLKMPPITKNSAMDATNAFGLRNRSHKPIAIKTKNVSAAPTVIALDISHPCMAPNRPSFGNVESAI